jgi:hypothetical protein
MKENKQERILDGMTVKEGIFRCGELQLPYEQVVLLVSEQHPVNRNQLLADLQTPGTDEYEWYQSGVAEGNLKLNANLEYNVGDPKSKDAYKHLSAERLRQAINEKLQDLFGI